MKIMLFLIVLFCCLNARAQIYYPHNIDTVATRLDTIRGQIVFIQNGAIKVQQGIQIKEVFLNDDQFYIDWDRGEELARPIRYELCIMLSALRYNNGTIISAHYSKETTPISTKNVIHFIPD